MPGKKLGAFVTGSPVNLKRLIECYRASRVESEFNYAWGAVTPLNWAYNHAAMLEVHFTWSSENGFKCGNFNILCHGYSGPAFPQVYNSTCKQYVGFWLCAAAGHLPPTLWQYLFLYTKWRHCPHELTWTHDCEGFFSKAVVCAEYDGQLMRCVAFF